ncbi:MAG TPA: hypothetical protein VFW65_03835 [Pseudonocardiaceae bacterium]|nr:hypothetical protein [Pseudonocardiaceae bacterium]
MGIRARWRAGHMKDPVSGVFRVEGDYFRHPNGSSWATMLTGVVVADGLPPTAAEVPADMGGKWVGQTELPVTVDRADPGNVRVEWDRVVANDPRETARQRAAEAAARMVAGPPPAPAAPHQAPVPEGMAPMVDQALRSAGIDPSFLHAPGADVHVTTSFGTAAPQDFQAMLAGMVGPTVPATGVVRAVAEVPPSPMLPPGVTHADVTVDVRRPDGTTYPVMMRIGFSTWERRRAVATPGTELPLLVNQSNPGLVRVDVAKLNLP